MVGGGEHGGGHGVVVGRGEGGGVGRGGGEVNTKHVVACGQGGQLACSHCTAESAWCITLVMRGLVKASFSAGSDRRSSNASSKKSSSRVEICGGKTQRQMEPRAQAAHGWGRSPGWRCGCGRAAPA